MIKLYVLIGLMSFSVVACKRSSTPRDVEILIADNCAQNPVHFFRQEKEAGLRLYRFGAEDARFRQELAAYQARFQQTGEDLTGQEKVRFVRGFLPRFVASCQTFFQPVVAACGAHPIDSVAFRQCVAPYNVAFREHLQKTLSVDAEGLIHLEPAGQP